MSSLEDYRRRQRAYQGLTPGRQAAEARQLSAERARRRANEDAHINEQRQSIMASSARYDPPPEAPRPAVDWTNPDAWDDYNGKNPILIRLMEDSHLWRAVIWAVRQIQTNFSVASLRAYAKTQAETELARAWLVQQPLFRSLVQEGIRRCLTWPDDVFAFLHATLVNENYEMDGYKPWRDPNEEDQNQELQGFLNQPTELPDGSRRNLRLID